MSREREGSRLAPPGRAIKAARMPLLLVSLALAVVGAPVGAQAPDEAWRTIRTEHFRITFPDRLEELARRAGDRAEWAWQELSDAFIEPPDDLIDVLLTDHSDVSNGFAGVTPGNRITVHARPPVDALSIGHNDEWLELVILHELAHIVHLDYSDNPVGRLARAVFGRVNMTWPFFPELGTPRWISEGLATWYESRLTQAGRVRGTFLEMQIRTAVLEGRFERIDQASGQSPAWPAGSRPYAYGSLFFDFLLARHGETRMAAFVEAVAGQWVPYRLDAAGRDAFGVSLSEEWEAWRDALEAQVAGLDERLGAQGPVTEAELLTEGARWGLHPQLSPDGRWLAHTQADGRSDTQIRLMDLQSGASRTLARTNDLGVLSWLPGGQVLLSQVDLDDPYRLYADLWVFDPVSGEQRRVTRRARLTQPSAAPGGGAWAIQEGDGTNTIVRVDLDDGSVTPLIPRGLSTHWAFPRPSPNGRWLVATRWEPNAQHDVVILDAESGSVVDEVTRDRALDTSPSWTPDGRGIVWASDRSGILNILTAEVDPDSGEASSVRAVTNLRTGGAYPVVDSGGESVYFSRYTADGWEIARAPFSFDASPEASPAVDRFAAVEAFPRRGTVAAEAEAYSPWPTLAPSYWEISWREPVEAPAVESSGIALAPRQLLGAGIGMQSSGFDLVGRHAWSAGGRVTTSGGKVEGGASYAYFGLGRPIFTVSGQQRYDSGGQLLGGDAPDQDTLLVLERTRDLDASVTFPAPRVRYNLSVTLGAGVSWEDRELWTTSLRESSNYSLTRPSSQLTSGRVALNFSTARSHAFQVGTARGVRIFVQGRVQNELQLPDSLQAVAGVDRSLAEVVGRIRGAVPLWNGGYASHVLALRASGGVAGGPGAGALQFRVGGASGQQEPLTGFGLFGGDFLLFPVRGYGSGSRFGRRAWSATAEYRAPLWLLNRGFRAWPIHADRLMGSIFVDAGNAWGPDLTPSGFQNGLRDPLASVGAEVTAEVLGLYNVLVRLRLGVAKPLVQGEGEVVYLRVGLPF